MKDTTEFNWVHEALSTPSLNLYCPWT